MKTVGLLFFVTVFFSSCEYLNFNNKISAEQIQAEEERPFIFIDITGNVEPDRITCQITNNAAATTYKNIDVTIHYFMDTRELIRSEHHVLEATVGPKSTVKHIIAINPPPIHYSIVYYSVKNAEVVTEGGI
ncbi:MAG TPA: hypothetical protein PLJ00_16405 [Chitinophagales bacterium]|nr:hypothetical protein [Chitinophagales bacterium]HRG29482.1 hypothetical protein [Chitinophagales bacterium]HRG87033.1 hypothetical protein [Chitinophagales bacterium]HRH52101.1 hypothetical protein [Chitinophagales bacterium]